MKMAEYSIQLLWSDDDCGYVATVPELEGLSAFGTTAQEALGELDTAKDLYLATCRDRHVTVPPPRVATEYSGQIRLRMPPVLHRRLTELARADARSLNATMVSLLEAGCNGRSFADEVKSHIDRKLAAASFPVMGLPRVVSPATESAAGLPLPAIYGAAESRGEEVPQWRVSASP
jgi:predicted RNase H-like HicB family nuclease